MSVRSDVLLWAQRVIARKQAPAHEVLQCEATADLETIQKAFHTLARLAHPDLHRNTLDADELELVTTAYSRAASAYAEMRTQRTKTTRIRPIRNTTGETAAATPGTGIPAVQPPAQPTASSSMSSKALVYFRKAEAALRRGDLTAAVLQLKMAIAADPHSTFLRTALGEVEAELRK